jgi:hypothetical protein
MHSARRNRCGPCAIALCLGLVVLAQGAGALSAEHWLSANGTLAHAEIETGFVGEYIFMENGVLGEMIPQYVDNVTLSNRSCTDCRYVREGEFRIHFSAGNYTLNYDIPVRDNHLQGGLSQPYNVTVHLPEGYDVRNPFLGSISRGGTIISEPEGGVRISWTGTRSWEVRYYDSFQEKILILFGTIWIMAVVVLVVPYFLLRRKGR